MISAIWRIAVLPINGALLAKFKRLENYGKMTRRIEIQIKCSDSTTGIQLSGLIRTTINSNNLSVKKSGFI